MNRKGLSVIAAIPAVVAIVGTATGSAQTRWVHINHPRAGNIIITPVDLNTASRADLMRLPGMTDTVASQIIDGRPFRAKSELLDRKIVSSDLYAKISGRVIASEDAVLAR